MVQLSGFRLALVLALALPAAAVTACTRPFIVPMSPTGLSVVVNGASVAGIYPEMLRAISARSGCEFKISAVPRARLEALFEAGKADLLVPATRSARRDQLGSFIPLVAVRPAAISYEPKHAPLRNLQDLIERKELRVALVRGYDYGEAYQALVKELTAQGRILLDADPVGVARLLHANFADLTIMPLNVMAGAIQSDTRVESMAGKLRIEQLDELPWVDSGVYISKVSVAAEDRAELENLVAYAAKSGVVWEGYKRYYSPEILNSSLRPR